jgi:hypothetical protein
MADEYRLLILSDVHYASDAEKAMGECEFEAILNPALRLLVKCFRHFFWMRNPHAHNGQLDRFLEQAGTPDWVIGNGDYSCDAGFIGIATEAVFASVSEVFAKLNHRFPDHFRPNYGDHELGKMSLFGGQGGLRLSSWQRSQSELGMTPFWQIDLGSYKLMGMVSSLIALPVYEPEVLPEELPEWQELRAQHLRQIARAFRDLSPSHKVILFCHDPTALPWLLGLDEVRSRLSQIEVTWIGHLHSPFLLWKSRLLAGMPVIRFLGNSIRRMSAALHEARCWSNFKVRLCPALAGTQLLKDGGYFEMRLDPSAQQNPCYLWHPLPWS